MQGKPDDLPAGLVFDRQGSVAGDGGGVARWRRGRPRAPAVQSPPAPRSVRQRLVGAALANANSLQVLDFDKLRLKVHFLFTIHEIVFSKVKFVCF